MSKADAIAYYERIILLRFQLFLRVIALAGTLLIFSTYYQRLLGTHLSQFGLQESYAAALLIVFSVSLAVATIDLPVRFVYKRIKNRLSRWRG